jgi:hypothetical protein
MVRIHTEGTIRTLRTRKDTMDIQYPQVTVQLTGQDGNAFNIIGLIRQAIAREVGETEAKAWSVGAMMCGSYDELLVLAQTTVHVI